jgi:hypothetical protein
MGYQSTEGTLMGRGIAVVILGILAIFGFSFYWTWNVESLSDSIGMVWWVIIFVAGILILPLAAVIAIRRSSRKTVSFMGASRRSKEIQSSGRSATATVLSIGEISPGRSVTVGGQPYLRLILRVDDQTRPPYEVTVDTIIAHYQLAQFQPGAMFAVMVDAVDPQAVVIAPERTSTRPADSPIGSAPGTTPVIVAEGWSQTDLIKLERDGKHGLAKVVAAAATGRFEGANPVEQIDYEILLPGEEPYTVSKQIGLPPNAVPQIESTIGKSFPVTVHPNDPDKISVSFTF